MWFDDSRFAFCRGLASHAWKYPPRLEYHGRELLVTLECANCGSKRRDRLSPGSGSITRRSYDYADGYLLELDGKKRPPKDDLRRDAAQLLLRGLKVVHLPARRKARAG